MRIHIVSVLALALAATSLTGCKKILKTEKIEAAAKDHLKKAAGWDATISCPKTVDVKTGGTFECTGKADGKDIVLTVTQKDDKGNVTIVLKSIDGKDPSGAAAEPEEEAAPPEAE
jgi:hypothetical protein